MSDLAEKLEAAFVGKTYEKVNEFIKWPLIWISLLINLFAFKDFNDDDVRNHVENFRILGPHTPATRDFQEDRANLILDEHNVVESVRFF
jgi:hypothetical protein